MKLNSLVCAFALLALSHYTPIPLTAHAATHRSAHQLRLLRHTAGGHSGAVTGARVAEETLNREAGEVRETTGAKGTGDLVRALEYRRKLSLEDLARLIDEGADVNEGNGTSESALHEALARGVKFAKLLLDRGADVNARNSKMNTPLHYAAARSDPDMLDFALVLLDKGADVNATNEYDQTPLHIAVSNNRLDTVKLLLNRGADVNLKDKWNESPLLLAFYNFNAGIIELLLNRGADPNVRDAKYKWTPLHHAVRLGLIDIARLLLDKGAEVNAETPDNQTALDVANLESSRQTEGMHALLTSRGGRTAPKRITLHTALSENAELHVIEQLLEDGADVNAKASCLMLSNATPLHCAAKSGRTDVVRMLLDRGAEVDARDWIDGTPLMRAMDTSSDARFEIAELLLQRGADINATDHIRHTAIHQAAQHGSLDTVQFLIAKGAKTTSTSIDGTPLQMAAGRTSVVGFGVVKALLDSGVDVNETNLDGKSPLDMCTDEATRELLMSRGGKETYAAIQQAKKHFEDAFKMFK